MLFLDGVYIDSTDKSRLRFRWVKAPTNNELTHLTHTIAHRVARYLERQDLLERDAGERDAGHTYLTADGVDEDPELPMNQLLGSSITYRIAVGPQQGRKVFTLQTLPDESNSLSSSSVAETAGFSLHAGVATKANERAKLERLCRYITRPAVSTKRLSLTRNGQVRYELKTPWRNGTTHVIFEPLDFISRLVSLDCRDAGGRATQEQLPRYPNRELISRVFMAFSRRIASIGYRSHLQSAAEGKRSKPQMKHKTKPPLRNGLQ
jgi:hypothetical protein